MKPERNRSFTIAVACCPGGHMVQARQLAPVYEKYDHFYVTFSGGIADEMKSEHRVHTVPDVLRHKPWSWFAGLIPSLRIAWKERPDVVISTGAGAIVPFCVFAKMLGAKLIFLESMAKVVKPTWTARMLYPISDLFLVQWPDLVKFFPKAQFKGRLF